MTVTRRHAPLRCHPPLHHIGCRGLTLIELVVALAIFAVLGTLTYRGTVHMLDAHDHLTTELETWRAVNRTFQLIETDLLHLAAPERVPGTSRAAPLMHQRGTNFSELIWLAHHPKLIELRNAP